MLILAATPIGNLADASPRLRETLAGAAVIAAEDTRTARKLLDLLDVISGAELVAVHDHNEAAKAPEIIERARSETVVLISDAGMPTVSDPGFRVVAHAVAQGVEVSVVPGPSAVISALAVSGLPTDRFTFEGFMPRKPQERRRVFRTLADETRTMVWFESPHRLAASLEDAADVWGVDRPAAVCRELTKRYEQTRRGTLGELAGWATAGVKGEVVVVVGGATPEATPLRVALARVQQRVTQGQRLKDACRQVAAATERSARELYEAALREHSDFMDSDH